MMERADYPLLCCTVYATTSYTYDSEGNLIKISDAKGNDTYLSYDTLGRKKSMNDPDMNVWNYEYDLNGNLVKQTGCETTNARVLATTC